MPSLDVYNQLKTFLSEDFDELIIICPFISINAIKKVFQKIKKPENKKITVVTRWRKLDIITGVSDLNVYTFLKKKKIELLHHDKIHLKAFIKDRKHCFFGSANLTETGLGTTKNANIELNEQSAIDKNIYWGFVKIVEESFLIDDKFYTEMLKLKKKNIKLYNRINQIKKKFKQDLDWYEFLAPAFNREDFMKKYL